MTTDPYADRAVALAFLAANPGGVTEAAVVAAGFSVQVITALVRDGLATGERDADRWTWSITAVGMQEATATARSARIAEMAELDPEPPRGGWAPGVSN